MAKFKFGEITQEQMDKAVAKFQKHNVGVRLNPNLTTNTTHYNEMIDAHGPVSVHSLKQSLRYYGRNIKYTLNDPILGENYAFSTLNNRDETVNFTHEECYLCIRAAIVERQEDASYIAKKVERENLEKWLNENKTKSQIKKEKQARLKQLSEEM